jgi:hypothetical protein
MNEQSTSELERDAERVRAEISDTAEHLKDKMSPGQLMDEVVNYFKDGDTNQLLTNLKDQVRDNPLALAMVGSGLAWLMMGSGKAHSRSPSPTNYHPSGRPVNTGASGASRVATAYSAGESGVGSSTGDRVSGVRAAAGDAASQASDVVHAATDFMAATMHDARDAVSESFTHAVDAGADYGARAKNTFLDALEREPLVIGALGVAVGAAIGAMLPTTRTEQEYLGSASTKARHTAESALADGVDKAREVAKDVYSAARDEADRQGFTSKDKPIVQKVADVARAAGSELTSAGEKSIDDASDTMDRATSPRKKA